MARRFCYFILGGETDLEKTGAETEGICSRWWNVPSSTNLLDGGCTIS